MLAMQEVLSTTEGTRSWQRLIPENALAVMFERSKVPLFVGGSLSGVKASKVSTFSWIAD
jgi:hypothetical protein